jgi:very-short-patch-repair endonuclease/energy-coupling factor transporter ATP-binding protein EcfA2
VGDTVPSDEPQAEGSLVSKARDRARRLFEFIKRFEERRASPRRSIDDAAWKLGLADLPKHPSIRVGSDADGSDAPLLSIQQPTSTPCPPPPSVLKDWLLTGWKEPDRTVEVQRSRNRVVGAETVTERFEDAPSRTAALAEWEKARSAWAVAERPAREADAAFQAVLALWARLQREGEDLRVYLGDAFLIWQREGDTAGPINHPLVLLEVELRFDEKRRELSFVEGMGEPFLYSELLSGLDELEGQKRKVCREIVERCAEEGGAHPLGGATTDRMIEQLGAVLGVREIAAPEGEPPVPSTHAVLHRQPTLLVVPPLVGVRAACDAFLEALASGVELPLALARIVEGEHDGPAGDGEGHGAPPGLVSTDLFFTQPANPAQEEIARRLEQSGTVLVQGPPGTGKTHTIANLLGHLLAQGKRVLVTAQTTKALRVLRAKVVEPLQPLCVSVLDSDLESRNELEHAVNGIIARLTRNASTFDAEAATQKQMRDKLAAAVASKESQLREALRGEYEDIVVGGEGCPPAQAARALAGLSDQDDWVPGPLTRGFPAPLDDAELTELYRLNAEVTAADEALVLAGLPDPRALLASDEFAKLTGAIHQHQTPAPTRQLWPTGVRRPTIDAVEQVWRAAGAALEPLQTASDWQLAATEAGLRGAAHREVWDSLLAVIDQASNEYPRLRPLALEYEVVLTNIGPLDDTLRVAEELLAHVERGGSTGWFARLGKSGWGQVLESVRVSGGPPSRVEHFRSLVALLRLERLRDLTRRRWTSLLGPVGHPIPDAHATTPETYTEAVAHDIRRALAWGRDQLEPVYSGLRALGVDLGALLSETPTFPPHAEVRRMVTCFRDRVVPGLAYEVEAQQRALLEGRLEAGLAALPGFPALGAARGALQALRSHDVGLYASSIEELWRLWNLRAPVDRRQSLLHKVQQVAPTWAAALQTRTPKHAGPTPPGHAGEAWVHRQWAEELDRRQRTDVQQLQHDLGQVKDQLRDVTARLVENLAWGAQVRRTDHVQQRALMAWLNLVRRIGKGTGIRADEFKREAQRHMNDARGAVPVWIMPLSRVTESFQPGEDRFDVVILDEASQCDLKAVVAMTLANAVVVVGDDAQVSPVDVGQTVAGTRALQDEYLSDFKDRSLFDGRASAYEIAQRSFPGGLIRLVEHFRCVPDIIAFSNGLSYKHEIRPLREAKDARVFPPLIAHRVASGERPAEGNTNRPEALEVASLVVAATQMRGYDGLTMGVIGLLGDAQAKDIDTLLRQRLDAGEYKRRRIVCGNPAHFQGDERDVMFLSMVHSPGDQGPLRLLDTEDMKRRYNVAASRARDQLWVVHSLNLEKDLKPGDLRRRLLEHALDPKGIAVADQRDRTESDFERRVFAALDERGYRLLSQVEVGAYRIDLVVEGSGSRVAVECDGDRFHPIETLDKDLERQAILERLGWRFLRLRGTAFYRHPEKEIERLCKRLKDLRVDPLGRGAEAPAAAVNEVRDQAIRLAAEIRQQWLAEAGSLAALFERATSPSRRSWNQRGRPRLELVRG